MHHLTLACLLCICIGGFLHAMFLVDRLKALREQIAVLTAERDLWQKRWKSQNEFHAEVRDSLHQEIHQLCEALDQIHHISGPLEEDEPTEQADESTDQPTEQTAVCEDSEEETPIPF